MPHASELNFLSVATGELVPSIEGRLFCSSRDPQREAQLWLHQQKISNSDLSTPHCLMGLGAGFHLNLLLKQSGLAVIQVIEWHQQLIEHWISENSNLADRVMFSDQCSALFPVVFEFRPAWNGNEKFYHDFSQRLRRATARHLREEAEQHGCWMLSEALESNINSTFEMTVKDIAHLFPLENQTEEARLWRTLREFVK